MSTTDEILRRIEKGGTLDELAKESDMRIYILMARIEFLVRAGYLCETREGSGCAECLMCKT